MSANSADSGCEVEWTADDIEATLEEGLNAVVELENLTSSHQILHQLHRAPRKSETTLPHRCSQAS